MFCRLKHKKVLQLFLVPVRLSPKILISCTLRMNELITQLFGWSKMTTRLLFMFICFSDVSS